MIFREPTEREARPHWREVPAGIVSDLERIAGDKIISADIAWGGFGPSACFTAHLSGGKNIFIKGSHPGQDAHGAQMLRQEIDFYGAFRSIQEFSPRYLGQVWDGDEDGWMLAVFEHVSTVPTLPWTPEKTAAALNLLSRLHAADGGGVPDIREKNFVRDFLDPPARWKKIYTDTKAAARFFTLFKDAGAGQKWTEKNAAAFLKEGAIGSDTGVIHTDLRSDNILFGAEGRCYFIDWPDACRGPVALDVAYFLSSVAAEKGGSPPELLGAYQKFSGRKIEKENRVAALVSLSGYLADNAPRAVPEKLPRLRWVQKSILWAMLDWLAQDGVIAPPPEFRP